MAAEEGVDNSEQKAKTPLEEWAKIEDIPSINTAGRSNEQKKRRMQQVGIQYKKPGKEKLMQSPAAYTSFGDDMVGDEANVNRLSVTVRYGFLRLKQLFLITRPQHFDSRSDQVFYAFDRWFLIPTPPALLKKSGLFLEKIQANTIA